MSIWGSIKALRKSKRWTQSKLAEISGLHQGDISKIESGKANVEVATLEAISSALDAEFVLVPRRSLGAVEKAISQHLNYAKNPQTQIPSIIDNFFIPDGDDDVDDDSKVPMHEKK